MVYTDEFLEKIPSVDFCLADTRNTQVTYYLFKSPSQTKAITLSKQYILPEEDRRKPTKFFFHGFTTSALSPWYKDLKTEYFKKGPHNIIYVDWSSAANKEFLVSAANIKPVGEEIADFIITMKIPLDKVHLIGHSLGSHLAGFIGKSIYSKTAHKVARITATDPAGPAFERVGPESRLSKYDANFVDVYHTDIGYYGITKPIGHVDYYVNGGSMQPGCPHKKIDDGCSHARSNRYFIESINTKNVTAVKAKFNEVGKIVIMNNLDKILFGDLVPNTVRGIYTLKTDETEPFLIPDKIKKI